jgi:hypothetical protein
MSGGVGEDYVGWLFGVYRGVLATVMERALTGALGGISDGSCQTSTDAAATHFT